MTLRHLRIFVTVCDVGSVTQAAKQLFLAQPTVSLAIHELEAYYGVRLFDRIARRLYITQVGEQFLSYARHITGLYDDLEQGIRNWESQGVLRVGSSVTIGTCLLPGYIQAFSQQYPHLRVQVTVDNSEHIEDKVLSNELDFALVEGNVHRDQIHAEAFLDDKLVLICGPTPRLWEADEVTLEELLQEDFLLREPGGGTRTLLDSTLLTHGITVEPLWTCISTEALMRAVEAGLGVSVLPQKLVQPALDAGRLRTVPIQGVTFARKFHIIHHVNKYLSEPALAFMALCR